jgi:pimeloyl-ACP methyl ester carboxylesterase
MRNNAAMSGGFAEAKTARVRDTTLAYVERGDGDPLVLVHGDLSDLRTWAPQLEHFGRSHRAVAYSRRYARPNQDIAPGELDELPTHADDLAALLEAIGAAPAHLVGNSSGAFACLLLAIARPDLVRTLVLCEPPVLTLFVSGRPRPSEMLRVFARSPRTAATIAKFGATVVAPAERDFRRGEDERGMLRFANGVLGRERFARMPEERRRQAAENRSGLRASLLGPGFPPLADADVRAIDRPVLLMGGAESPVLFARLLDRLEELLPRVERTVVPGASHAMHEENAAFVNDTIDAFLARHAA